MADDFLVVLGVPDVGLQALVVHRFALPARPLSPVSNKNGHPTFPNARGAEAHVYWLAVATRAAQTGLFCQARLAQSAERKALNLVVVGSSPTVGALFGSEQRGLRQ